MQEHTIKESERTLASAMVALSLVAGLLLPQLAAALYPHFLTALFFVVVFSLNVQAQKPVDVLRAPDRFTGLAVLWQMAGIPLTLILCGTLVGVSPLLMTLLVAVSTAGSVFASPALAYMLGLNRRIAMRGMILSTCVMPFSLLLFGEVGGVLPTDLSLRQYALHIGWFIVAPILISSAFWRIRERMPAQATAVTVRTMHWASTASLMIFCAGLMMKVHMAWDDHGHELASYAILATTLAVAMYAITVAVFYSFGPDKALTAGMLAANRNVALSFALLSSVFPPEVMTFVAVSQFPIFLAPFVARMLMRFRYRRQTA